MVLGDVVEFSELFAALATCLRSEKAAVRLWDISGAGWDVCGFTLRETIPEMVAVDVAVPAKELVWAASGTDTLLELGALLVVVDGDWEVTVELVLALVVKEVLDGDWEVTVELVLALVVKEVLPAPLRTAAVDLVGRVVGTVVVVGWGVPVVLEEVVLAVGLLDIVVVKEMFA